MQIRLDFCDPRASIAAPTDQASAAGTNPGAGALRCAFDSPLQTLIADTADQVKPLLDAVQALAKQGRWCVGYLRYEAAGAFDSAYVTHNVDAPLAWFGVFEQALPWPESECVDPADPADQAPKTADETPIDWQCALSRPEFDAQMASIAQAIAAGECYQVNYTAPLKARFADSAAGLFERLQRAQPGGYAALIDTGSEQVLSVSPELFFDWQDGQILTRPMKGTAPRGATASADAALAAGLTTSPKERAENVMIVDLLRNDLSRIALPHSVKVPALFRVQSLPTVHQMVSDVTAATRPGTTLADVFTALFPCGSVTGAPKVRAMQMIRALEPQPRGIYCGAIGVVRPGGHATFSVAIRTVCLHGETATCGIGSGITFDATADDEWREWQHKRGFLERAGAAFGLLETLRLEGRKFHNLEAHLARLQGAAAHFGYPFDELRIRQTLTRVASSSEAVQGDRHGHTRRLTAAMGQRAKALAQHQPKVWRVRLQLDPKGQPTVRIFIHKSTPEPVSIALAAIPFEASQSEFTRFKTTHRAHYEAFAPTGAGIFDTLLYNPQNELTECTRGNVALLLDGQWLTPALHCGLLAGVGRARCLSEGVVQEAVITLGDLPRVQALAFINSLRGWLDARLVQPR